MSEQTKLEKAIHKLQSNEIEVSLFIDPHPKAVKASKKLGVEWIEFHTGKYANIYAMLYTNLSKTHHTIPELELSRQKLLKMLDQELLDLRVLSEDARELGLRVAAGHPDRRKL